ncbi:5117_t:CDS:2, partial [Ambispora leptoticha]
MASNSTIIDAKNEQAEIATISPSKTSSASTSSFTTTNYKDNNDTISKETSNSPLSTYSFQVSKKKRGRKKKVKSEESDFEPPKKKRGRKKKVENEESDFEPPKKKRGRKKKVTNEGESNSELPKKKRGRKKKVEGTSQDKSIVKWINGIFKDLRIFIVPQNIDRVRLELLKTRIKERGGSVLEVFIIHDVTHIITELKGKKLIHALNINKMDELLQLSTRIGFRIQSWYLLLVGSATVCIILTKYIIGLTISEQYDRLVEIDNYVVHLNGTKSHEAVISRKLDEKDATTATTYTTTNNDETSAKNYSCCSDSEISFLNITKTSYNNDDNKLVNASQDPLKEIIAEARHLTEEGIYSDEEDEAYDQEESSVSSSSARPLDSANEEKTLGSHVNVNNIPPKNPVSPISKTGEGEIFRLKTIHTYGEIDENPNKLIIDKLNLILEYYQKTSKDQWRILAYRKAISALKKQEKPITTFEEAKKIPGIGDCTAKKIAEIIETGHLKRLDNFGEAEPVLTMFTKIH